MKNETSKKIALSVLQCLFRPSDVEKLKRSRAVVMFGLPGCGKTTIANLLVDAFGFQRHSTDEIRITQYQQDRHDKDDEKVNRVRYAVYEELGQKIVTALKNRRRIVVDATNLEPKRMGILGCILSQVPAEDVTLVVIRTPGWIVKQRFIHTSQTRFEEWWRVYQIWKRAVQKRDALFPTKQLFPQLQIVKPRRYAVRTFDWVTDIKGIVWDLDGTLFQIGAQLQAAIDAIYQTTYAETLHLSLNKAQRNIRKRYEQLGSYTKVMDEVGVDGKELIAKIFNSLDYTDYLEPDVRMRNLLEKLGHLQHFIYNNSEREGALKKLTALGLSKKLFTNIFCSYEMKWSKQDPQSYRTICKETGFKPHQLLSVGDREKSDIIPAGAVGMRTCMVYGSSKVADVSLKNHYEVAELFGKEV